MGAKTTGLLLFLGFMLAAAGSGRDAPDWLWLIGIVLIIYTVFKADWGS